MNPDSSDLETALLKEQFTHMLDLMQGKLTQLEEQQKHDREFNAHRLDQLEEDTKDHETRLRSNTEGVTQFKLFSGLASGGSGILAVIALLKAFLGGVP